MAFNGISPEQLAIYMKTPAGKPPPGITPNFENPPRLRTATTIYIVLCLILTTSLVAMRIYTRCVVVKRLWWDDHFSMLAWLASVGGAAITFIVERDGGGVHQWDLHLSDFIQLGYDVMVAKAIYIVCILLLKLSILFQFLRVFVPRRLGNLVMFWGTTGLIAANVIFYIIEFFLAIIQCKPRVRGWNRSVPGTCIGSSNIVYTAAFNVISDFLILLLPLHRIWRLQMPTRRKIGISLTFATGIVACFTSIMRLYYSVYVLQTKDMSYYYLILGFWLNAELTVGIAVGCMPSLPRFSADMKSTWSNAWSKISHVGSKSNGRSSGSAEDQEPRADPYHFRRGPKESEFQYKVHSHGELDEAHVLGPMTGRWS